MVTAGDWHYYVGLVTGAVIDACLLACVAALAVGILRWGFRRRP